MVQGRFQDAALTAAVCAEFMRRLFAFVIMVAVRCFALFFMCPPEKQAVGKIPANDGKQQFQAKQRQNFARAVRADQHDRNRFIGGCQKNRQQRTGGNQPSGKQVGSRD